MSGIEESFADLQFRVEKTRRLVWQNHHGNSEPYKLISEIQRDLKKLTRNYGNWQEKNSLSYKYSKEEQ